MAVSNLATNQHQLVPIRDYGFQKGYNDTLPPEQVPPGYLADAQNCFIRTQEIVKRNGYQRLGTDIGVSHPCQGMKGFRLANGTKYLLAVFNGSIYYYTGSGNLTLATNGSAVLSTTAQVWIEIANNNAYFFDGTSTVVKFDGSAVSAVSAIPKGTGARWFHNILCVWGISGTPNNMQLSDLGNPENFSTGIATTVGINPNDGDFIVTTEPFSDSTTTDVLMIFKQQSIWSLGGFSTSSLTVSNLGKRFPTGCMALKGTVNTGSEVLYLAFRGDIPHIRSAKRTIYGGIVDGGIRTQDIETTMKGLNFSALNVSCAIFDGRNVWFNLADGSSTTNNFVIMLDTVTNGWVHHNGINAADMCVFLLNNSPQIFFGEAGNTARAYQFGNFTSDDGNAISFSITTRRYGLNIPEVVKKWRYLYIAPKETGNYNLTIDFSSDGFTYQNLTTMNLAGEGSMLDSLILDTSRLGSTDVHRRRFSFANLNSYYLQLHMYETSTISSVNLRDWELLYFARHWRRA
jgi:hypothetical protein